MLPWEHLASAAMPESGSLDLYRRGRDYTIRAAGIDLMHSAVHGSEEQLAALVCERLAARSGVRLLVGGLGMGFTLKVALERLGPDAAVEVSEWVEAVVEWNRDYFAAFNGTPLEDERVAVRIADVAGIIADARQKYDAILLDVDNGPEGLSSPANAALYGRRGIEAAWRSLKSGGILAVWSAGPDDAFAKRLRRAGFVVEEKRLRPRPGRGGGRYIVWLAVRGA
jgi:spermidine synthase